MISLKTGKSVIFIGFINTNIINGCCADCCESCKKREAKRTYININKKTSPENNENKNFNFGNFPFNPIKTQSKQTNEHKNKGTTNVDKHSESKNSKADLTINNNTKIHKTKPKRNKHNTKKSKLILPIKQTPIEKDTIIKNKDNKITHTTEKELYNDKQAAKNNIKNNINNIKKDNKTRCRISMNSVAFDNILENINKEDNKNTEKKIEEKEKNNPTYNIDEYKSNTNYYDKDNDDIPLSNVNDNSDKTDNTTNKSPLRYNEDKIKTRNSTNSNSKHSKNIEYIANQDTDEFYDNDNDYFLDDKDNLSDNYYIDKEDEENNEDENNTHNEDEDKSNEEYTKKSEDKELRIFLEIDSEGNIDNKNDTNYMVTHFHEISGDKNVFNTEQYAKNTKLFELTKMLYDNLETEIVIIKKTELNVDNSGNTQDIILLEDPNSISLIAVIETEIETKTKTKDKTEKKNSYYLLISTDVNTNGDNITNGYFYGSKIKNITTYHRIFTNANYMFAECKSLNNVIFKNNNAINGETPDIIYANAMFFDCENLKNIECWADFHIGNSTIDISRMLENCKKLESFYISGFDVITDDVDMTSIFSGCESLKTIPEKFRITNHSEGIFLGCNNPELSEDFTKSINDIMKKNICLNSYNVKESYT